MASALTGRVDPAAVAGVVRELRRRLGDDRVSTVEAVLALHAHDESFHPPAPPDAVLLARTTADVALAVERCAAAGVPVIPFGTGTALEGHVQALRGGLTIDLSGLDRVLRISDEDLDCTVEAGVTRLALNARLRERGLVFPVDPGADASLGGMAATRASGTGAVRYGTMRERVLGLRAVLPDGRVVTTGGRARKSSSGYDLTRLLVGSEGTLGVITELTLRLEPLPEAVAVATVVFPDVRSAVQTVTETVQSGIPVARAELMDEVQVDASNRYSGLDLDVAPTLLVELHGTPAGVEEQLARIEELALANGGGAFRFATREEDRARLMKARHDALYAALALRPGSRAMPTDVCVPISELPACVADARAAVDASPLIAPILGHVGDGNFHLTIVVDPDDPAELAEAARLNRVVVERGLRAGGTCTGEHGIGYGKAGYLAVEHGEGAVDAMRAIKAALDPAGIMNPGKVLPAA